MQALQRLDGLLVNLLVGHAFGGWLTYSVGRVDWSAGGLLWFLFHCLVLGFFFFPVAPQLGGRWVRGLFGWWVGRSVGG